MNTKCKVLTLTCLALVAIGCNGPDPTSNLNTKGAKKLEPVVHTAEAGVLVAASTASSEQLVRKQAEELSVQSRSNPFFLLGPEMSYEKAQFAENMTGQMGFYRMAGFSKPVPPQPTFINEAQPPRRLAGVLIGDSVSGLIDMNDGTSGLKVIRPGSELKGQSGQVDWVVQSIDEEKAILVRKDPNRYPRRVVVRLQQDLGTDSGGSEAGGGNTGGNAPAGGGNTGGGGGGRRRSD
ncbi:MAG: hypothetical protein ABL949_09260 [Fimbriimonadaceae bacterium]